MKPNLKEQIEGKYVVSIDGVVTNKRTGRPLTGKIDRYGYRVLCLSLDCGIKHMPLHRIIALSHIPNPGNLPQINHKDGNKLNNSLDNLEWVTAQQNTQHAADNGLLVAWNKGKTGVYSDAVVSAMKANQKHSKKVIVKNTGVVYNSVRELCSTLNLDRRTVQRVLHGDKHYNTINGLTLKYAL